MNDPPLEGGSKNAKHFSGRGPALTALPLPEICFASLRKLSALPQGEGGMRSKPSQRVSDRQVDLSRIRAQDRGRQQPAAVAFAGAGEEGFELAHVEIGGFAEAGVLAVEGGHAVHGLAVDGACKTARERRAVAGEIGPPV